MIMPDRLPRLLPAKYNAPPAWKAKLLVKLVFDSLADAGGQTPLEHASCTDKPPPIPTSASDGAVARLPMKMESVTTRVPACRFTAPPLSVATLAVKLLLAIVTFVGRDAPDPSEII